MMAYTGILVRGDTFNAIYLDPPIAREITMAGEHLACATMSSAVYYLNIAALSTIGLITDDQGTVDPGIKTSALPITYDGDGYLKEEADHLLVNADRVWYHDRLHFIGLTPTMSLLTINDVVVNFSEGVKALVYNETTRAELGIVDSSGATLTFGSAQTVGDIITAVCLDADYNHSAKHKLTIV